MEDAPKTRKGYHESLELQRWCRESKVEILKGLNLEKTKEHFLEATYYHRVYASLACWKGDVNVIDGNLAKLKSIQAQDEVFEQYIQMVESDN